MPSAAVESIGGAGRATRRPAIAAILLFAAAAIPLAAAPLYGEDVTSLRFFARDGFARALADCHGTMFGLSSVRFYRPLLSISLALQSAISFDATWLRTANLLTYALGVYAAARLAQHLGARPWSAFFAGACAALFAGGPGDWCWIVGRVDTFSFGFGMAGLALFADPDPAARRRNLALSTAAFAAAFLSKETALAFAPALLLLAVAISGWRGALRAAVPCAALAAGFAMRFWALEGSMGGYVGAKPDAGAALATLAPAELAKGLSLALGVPRAAVPAALGLLAIACAGAAFLGGARHAAPAALFAGAAILYIPGALVVAGLDDPPPVHARVFPSAAALLGIAAALAADRLHIFLAPRLGVRAAAAVAAAAALLWIAPGAASMARAESAYRDAAVALEREQLWIDAARAALPPAEPVLLVPGVYYGWPPERTEVHFHNLGLADRFAPPFHAPGGAAVWPLRPIGGGKSIIHVRRASPLFRALAIPPDGRSMPGLRLDDGPAVPMIELSADAVPRALTGGDAQRLKNGTFDVALALPSVPGAASLRVNLFTPQGADTATLPLAPSGAVSWKQLLGAPASGGSLLYQLPGYAVDFGADAFALRFEWLSSSGDPLAETPLRIVALDDTFRAFIRREEADPLFGIRH